MFAKFMLRGSAVLAVSVFLAGAAQAVTMETVSIGNLANTGEASGNDGSLGPARVCGAVDYKYDMAKFEVTSGQYVEFLNAVAVTDAYGLYNANMPDTSSGVQGPDIVQSGSPGSYTYTVHSTRADRPVCYVSWGDAARFVNWLHNGQPTGAQDLTTTEDGAYYLNGATSDAQLNAVTRESDWKWALPTEDEWYKAAYHKNDGDTGNYWDYATRNNIGDVDPGFITDGDLLSGPLTPFTDGSVDPGNYATWDGDGGQDGLGPFAYRTEVGEWENSGSAYGTFDQVGNLYEWTEEVHSTETKRLLRGGAHISGALDMQSRFRGWWFVPTDETYHMGFRVVRPTPPKGSVIIVQ